MGVVDAYLRVCFADGACVRQLDVASAYAIAASGRTDKRAQRGHGWQVEGVGRGGDQIVGGLPGAHMLGESAREAGTLAATDAYLWRAS